MITNINYIWQSYSANSIANTRQQSHHKTRYNPRKDDFNLLNTVEHAEDCEKAENSLELLLYPRKREINLASHSKSIRNTVTMKVDNRHVKLLIDSGAEVTLIKDRNINPNEIDQNEKLSLTGIGKGEVTTKGSKICTIQTQNGNTLIHKFHVTPNDFQICEDGILGRDFFDKFKVDIMYSRNSLKIGDELLEFTSSTKNCIYLPARSETVIEITTPTNDLYTCTAEEVKTGIFTPNCLIQPTNYKAKILVANTLPKDVILEEMYPHIEKIPEYNWYANTSYYNEDVEQKRKDEVLKIILGNLDQENNSEENQTILEMCEKYYDIFFLEGDRLSSIKGVVHNINLYTDSKPVHVQRYRMPHMHREEINKQVSEMLRDGKIKHSVSEFQSPLLLVPKKSGKDNKLKWRVVVDYRKLNDITIGDSFPLPNINDILDQLGHAQYFSTLDMASGYHQIEMNPADTHKTAFSTDYGHFEFVRMPFGLKNSQSTFQRAINNILRGFQGIKGFVYLDDVIIYGKNLKEHNQKLEEVFQICQINNLKLQCTKCQFLKKEITFLGHIITPHGIKPNPATVEAVQKFPTPRGVRETQSFLGLANYYRRFIPNFSMIAQPLTKLTRKGNTFEWTEEVEEAFKTLKQMLVTPPILRYPDFEIPFVLTTDASNHSLGAVLSQVYDDGEYPIAFASRALGKSERNYSTIEKEMLAVYWAVNNFRPYLYGKKFTIFTDHKPLTGDLRRAPKRIQHWILKLEEYNYDIVHKAGKINTNADALSRIKHLDVMVVTRAQAKKDVDAKPQTVSQTDIDTKIIPDTSSVIPAQKITTVIDPKTRLEILNEYHNLPLGGHAGTFRTYKRIRMMYYWPGMLTDINKFIRKCILCKRNKAHKRTKVPLTITTTSHRPFQRVAFDLVGPLPTTINNNNYMLTFQDDLTKFSGAIPVQNQEARTVAKAMCEYFITKYGIPETILTDLGANFTSKIFEQTCKLLKLKHITTTAYRPQTNGALEKSHQTLKEYLRIFTDKDQNNWDEMCHYAIFVYNTTPHCSSNMTPFQLVFGNAATIPTAIRKDPEPIYNYEDYVSELKARLRFAHYIARQNLIKKKEQTKLPYDKSQVLQKLSYRLI